jgi:hypothetical protein
MKMKVKEAKNLGIPSSESKATSELKAARIEKIKAENRALMQGRCYECGAKVETRNFIESGKQRYCFPCAAKGADRD